MFLFCSLICKHLVFCRNAGLPQYGQLGHGTDNEVSLYKFYFYFYFVHCRLIMDFCFLDHLQHPWMLRDMALYVFLRVSLILDGKLE